MNAILKNWKTTLAGVATLLTIIVHLANNGWAINATDIAGVTAAFGLVGAKDHNVTGGDVPQ